MVAGFSLMVTGFFNSFTDRMKPLSHCTTLNNITAYLPV
jgi:hypothetical protein